MARTIQEIQDEIIAAMQADSNLSEANSTSSAALWRLVSRIVATAIATLESLFDAFKNEVNTDLQTLKPHSLRWYQDKALLFQYGSDLPADSDIYDNGHLDDATIEAQKIIKQSAAIADNGTVKIKIAKEDSGGELTPLISAEYDAFEAYINEVKDAGVNLEIVNSPADRLVIHADIYYDALVLDASGNRVDGTGNNVVKSGIKSYLRQLPFDGVLVKSHLVDFLQNIEGVYVPEIRLMQASQSGASALQTVDIQYNPFSGFLAIDDQTSDLTLTFKNKETL